MQLTLTFVYERISKRRGYVHRRQIPKPLLVALHILCLRKMRKLDSKERRAPAWEKLIAYVAPTWSVEYETAHSYFYNDRYDSAAAYSLLDLLIEQGFATSNILAAIEQHLPCNRRRKFGPRTQDYLFNLAPFIRSRPKPRWRRHARRTHAKICPERSTKRHVRVSGTASSVTREVASRVEARE